MLLAVGAATLIFALVACAVRRRRSFLHAVEAPKMPHSASIRTTTTVPAVCAGLASDTIPTSTPSTEVPLSEAEQAIADLLEEDKGLGLRLVSPFLGKAAREMEIIVEEEGSDDGDVVATATQMEQGADASPTTPSSNSNHQGSEGPVQTAGIVKPDVDPDRAEESILDMILGSQSMLDSQGSEASEVQGNTAVSRMEKNMRI